MNFPKTTLTPKNKALTPSDSPSHSENYQNYLSIAGPNHNNSIFTHPKLNHAAHMITHLNIISHLGKAPRRPPFATRLQVLVVVDRGIEPQPGDVFDLVSYGSYRPETFL